MAWKGIEDDQGIYWSRLTATGWEPQRRVDGVGTTHSPTLVVLRDRLFMFWKGVEDDSGVYFSSLAREPGASWQPQKNVTYPVNSASGFVFASIGTSRGPSATQHGDQIMLAWKGAQDDQAIYFSLFDGNEFTGQIAMSGVGTSEGRQFADWVVYTHGVEGSRRRQRHLRFDDMRGRQEIQRRTIGLAMRSRARRINCL